MAGTLSGSIRFVGVSMYFFIERIVSPNWCCQYQASYVAVLGELVHRVAGVVVDYIYIYIHMCLHIGSMNDCTDWFNYRWKRLIKRLNDHSIPRSLAHFLACLLSKLIESSIVRPIDESMHCTIDLCSMTRSIDSLIDSFISQLIDQLIHRSLDGPIDL